MPHRRKKQIPIKKCTNKNDVKKYTYELLEKLDHNYVIELQQQIDQYINSHESDEMDAYEQAICIYKKMELLIDQKKLQSERKAAFYAELGKHDDIILEQHLIDQYAQRYIMMFNDNGEELTLNEIMYELCDYNDILVHTQWKLKKSYWCCF